MLLLVTFGALSPLLSSGFIDFDDDLYVTANRHVRAGLTWSGIGWALQSTTASNWHPITWLAHMLDCQLYGLQAWGHHLSSILLHGLNSALLFYLLKRLTSSLWPSFLVATLFALHPLHVESVAWVSERKDVLSTMFFLLTLLAYVQYAGPATTAIGIRQANLTLVRSRAKTFYALALLLFGLGLMAKPMLVTLPLVLLLLDFWPLQRLQLFGSGVNSTGRPTRNVSELLLEKVPFFVLAGISSIVTFRVQKQSGALAEMAGLPLLARAENVLVSYCRYLGKTFWPADLTLYYPYPDHWSQVQVGSAAVLLVGLTVLAWAGRRRCPWFLMGWAWFVITLGPVIGWIQVGGQSMADRYTYIPLIGIFLIVAWGLQAGVSAAQAGGARVLGRALSWVPLPVALTCGVLAYHQARYWRSSESLWAHALAVTQNNFLAHVNLGLDLERQHRFAEAASEFREAIRLRPTEAKPHANLANVLCRQERVEEGINEFREAIRLDPGSVGARHNLAFALCQQHRFEEGIVQFEAILSLRPDSAQTHLDLGVALADAGRISDAIAQVERALQLRPDFPQAQRQLQALRKAAFR